MDLQGVQAALPSSEASDCCRSPRQVLRHGQGLDLCLQDKELGRENRTWFSTLEFCRWLCDCGAMTFESKSKARVRECCADGNGTQSERAPARPLPRPGRCLNVHEHLVESVRRTGQTIGMCSTQTRPARITTRTKTCHCVYRAMSLRPYKGALPSHELVKQWRGDTPQA